MRIRLLLLKSLAVTGWLAACTSPEKKQKEQTDTAKIQTSHAQAITQENVAGFSKTFEGDIAGKYPITMTLTRNGNEILGTYSYTKVGTVIQLAGSINEQGKFSLQEADNKGNITGVFEGDLTRNFGLSGNWHKPNESKLLPFTLHESDNLTQKNKTGDVGVGEENYTLKGKDDMEADLSFPVVKGNLNANALKKINQKLSVNNLFDESIDDIKATYAECSCGTIASSYEVNYNKNSILDISIFTETMGAYSSGFTYRFAFNTATGDILTIDELLKPESLNKLAATCDKLLQERINTAIKEATEEDREVDWLKELVQDKRFTAEHLKNFTIKNNGISFYYPFGFPHAALALEPDDIFEFTFAQLSNDINPDGLLSAEKPK